MKLHNFVELVDSYGRTVPKGAPSIMVAHPFYGYIGECHPEKGFRPKRGRWASTQAILRDSDRKIVKVLRGLEDRAPAFVAAALAAALTKNPLSLPTMMGAISTYDGIVAARGGGAYQDVWWALVSAFGTPVTLCWYDTWKMTWSPGAVPTVTAYTNAGTGGAVMDAASNGSWLTNPAGSNKKYIIGVGLSITSLTGMSLAMLVDTLWAGSYSLITNTTINPTTDVAVTRWTGSDSPGNMMMMALTSTLTHTVAATITTSYVNQGGTGGQSSISICPATGPLVNRVILNTIHNSATINASTPFMPLSNGGNTGVRSLEQVVISGGTMTVGTADHKIVRPLILMPFIAANSFIEQDTTLNIGNMTELKNASQVCGCLGWLTFSGGTTVPSIATMLRMVEG
jgi:hypothetical protein